MSRLVLFDIDGTMLDSAGAGLAAIREGFAEAFPEESAMVEFPELDLGGATDGSVIHQLFTAHRVEDTTENREVFFECYLSRLVVTLEECIQSGRGGRKSGVPELVGHLADSPHHLGLLTGNIAAGARLKLEAFGYDFACFPVGAFGCDHADRNQLGPIAIQRASVFFEREFVPAADVLIIGDTPKDIACARACGASVLAVATGASDYPALEAGEPDWLFEDLSDWEEVIEVTGLHR